MSGSQDKTSTGKTIIQQTPAALSKTKVNFDKSFFDGAIQSKGYEVLIEKALRCPCKVKGSDNLSDCQNCAGSGWFYINPTRTRAILHSMNLNTRFKEWSEESMGTVSISTRDVDEITFMDKLTLTEGLIPFSQVVYPVSFKGVLFAFTIYDIQEIRDVFIFEASDQKLTKLAVTEDFTFERNKLILNKKFSSYKSLCISVKYIHRPQYHVIDLNRELMRSDVTVESTGLLKNTPFPISAIGRRSHYILDAQNYEGNYLFDNSYEIKCT